MSQPAETREGETEVAPAELIARLRVRLKGFAAADTSSQAEGHLEPGDYLVGELRLRRGARRDVDYARVVAPALGAADTWICTRSGSQRYAEILEVERRETAPPLDFSDDPLSVPERALIELLPAFYVCRYDRDEARYPFPLKGVAVPQAPPLANNCCTFVEALLVRAWQQTHGDRCRWSAARHAQMMILSDDDMYSPVTAVVEAGLGVLQEDVDAAPQPWTLVQGWRRRWRGGHTFLIVEHHPPTDRLLTLESNSSYGLDGVGCRMLGNIAELPDKRPPPRWWEDESLWTWRRVRSTYRHRRCATLKITDRDWSGRAEDD